MLYHIDELRQGKTESDVGGIAVVARRSSVNVIVSD
jgi:hypothetical protein